jgi:hypothetical protein
MKSSLKALVATALMAFAITVSADDKAQTFTGKGECAKCSLGKTKACQMAVTVKEDGKDTTYLVENNDVSKKFHKNVCQSTADVTVKGKLKEVDGQKVIEASEIHLAKK